MGKTYLAWRDSNCNGKNVEWIRMNGKEFTSFIKKTENRGRYFIRLDDPECKGNIIYIESSKDTYDSWKKEWDSEAYRYKKNAEVCKKPLSLNYLLTHLDDVSVEEMLENKEVNYEEVALNNVELRNLKDKYLELDDEEKFIINICFFINEGLSESQIANKYGIPRTTLRSKKEKILKKLKK